LVENLGQVLLLLGIAVAVVLTFQRFHIPTALGYLLVGVILGPHTFGPNLYAPELEGLAEFGVVFLLFTIGLNFSLPQLHALRHQVLGLGTGQVALTTALVALILWAAGLPGAAAFVIGAVFAQSSTTIIASQLREQGEENSQHGRFGVAISVFQDVTAVPFLVIIPVLGTAAGLDALGVALGWAMGKAALAFALVFFVGRWALAPLFHVVAARRSAEIFTLAVLLVALLAAWTTSSLGLSLAFGGFLAGMMLGETEFRHQVESSIRPFRDVLLWLFFVGIGMRFDPSALPPIWHWALLGAVLILISKFLVVSLMLRATGADAAVAWRTGLLLAVGGEFGFALVVVAMNTQAISADLSQIAIAAVLLAMVAGAFLIRFNGAIAGLLTGSQRELPPERPSELSQSLEQQVVIGGYGRVGHTVAVLLQTSGVPFVAFDTDPKRVAQGRADGFPVFFGDISDAGLLSAVHVERATLAVITVDHPETALTVVSALAKTSPQVPVIARARDLDASARLMAAGATYALPEAIEASLRLGAAALSILKVPNEDIEQILQGVRDWGYQPVAEEGSRA
jgi:CPA2 family monovalent cation:H+ antiporter-2